MAILQQCGKGGALMIMGDFPARPAPEPLDPVGVGIVGWGVNEAQMALQLGQHLAHQLRARGRMGAQVVGNHERLPSLRARTLDRRPHLSTKDRRRAPGGDAPVKPAVAPVDEPEAIDLIVSARGFHQALSPSAFATPHPGQGRVERELDLILEIDIGVRQEVDQLVNIRRHCSEQVSLAQRRDGWRGGRASPGQDHLHPEAFPT